MFSCNFFSQPTLYYHHVGLLLNLFLLFLPQLLAFWLFFLAYRNSITISSPSHILLSSRWSYSSLLSFLKISLFLHLRLSSFLLTSEVSNSHLKSTRTFCIHVLKLHLASLRNAAILFCSHKIISFYYPTGEVQCWTDFWEWGFWKWNLNEK